MNTTLVEWRDEHTLFVKDPVIDWLRRWSNDKEIEAIIFSLSVEHTFRFAAIVERAINRERSSGTDSRGARQ